MTTSPGISAIVRLAEVEDDGLQELDDECGVNTRLSPGLARDA